MSIYIKLKKLATNIIISLKDNGFIATWKVYKWKLFAVLFCYYLVRDLLLYVIIPYLAFSHLS